MSHTPKPPLIPRRHISTQALDTETVSAIAEQLRRIEQIKSTRPHNTPLDSIEELPLDAAESIIGLQAQGDAHRNDLELLYDRIMGHAEAPIHTGTTPAPAPAPLAPPKTLLSAPKTLLTPPAPHPPSHAADPRRQDPYTQKKLKGRRRTLDTLDDPAQSSWADWTLDRSVDGDDSASGWG